jgi:hypothetical protein
VQARNTHRLRKRLATAATVLAALPWLAGTANAQQPDPTIERLLAEGWEVAGFTAVGDNRTMILLRHKTILQLVQCSVLVDVTRTPRTRVYCVSLR